ncbi:hypothetical protein [Novosphingobium sp.]|uniref:hypothetical protein n=1 Tax=Novosphingobium sp. TaxID=1874826 RepID=UPI002609A0C5|nr:hypothetical protein [Novosphingobium sp.]
MDCRVHRVFGESLAIGGFAQAVGAAVWQACLVATIAINAEGQAFDFDENRVGLVCAISRHHRQIRCFRLPQVKLAQGDAVPFTRAASLLPPASIRIEGRGWAGDGLVHAQQVA